MDPNAAFRNLMDALRDGDYDAAQDALDALKGWEAGGGFRPTIPAPRLAEENERLRALLVRSVEWINADSNEPKKHLLACMTAALAGEEGKS